MEEPVLLRQEVRVMGVRRLAPKVVQIDVRRRATEETRALPRTFSRLFVAVIEWVKLFCLGR